MSNNEICLKSYAKINLCLDVIGKREDGYHDLVSIMQTVSLYDTIFMKKVHKDNYLKLATNLWHLPTDERNIVYRAIRLVSEKYNVSSGVFADIRKTIPVSAGLGGGSSNCATAINAMKELFSLDIPMEKLIDMGKSLGADVPFFFMRGTALAEGIGETLSPLPALPSCCFVLVRPPIIISTADVFKKFNIKNVKTGFDKEKMIYCLLNSDLKGVCNNFYNALESVTAVESPIINEIKDRLLMNGALGALMSGSGPTVFGCFTDKSAALEAVASIKKNFPEIKEIFITKNI